MKKWSCWHHKVTGSSPEFFQASLMCLYSLQGFYRFGIVNTINTPVSPFLKEKFRSHKLGVRFPGSWHDIAGPGPFLDNCWSTWLGVAEAWTLKLNFMVKKWRDQKIIFGILIYALCRFQNYIYKNPEGRIDTLMKFNAFKAYVTAKIISSFNNIFNCLLHNWRTVQTLTFWVLATCLGIKMINFIFWQWDIPLIFYPHSRSPNQYWRHF